MISDEDRVKDATGRHQRQKHDERRDYGTPTPSSTERESFHWQSVSSHPSSTATKPRQINNEGRNDKVPTPPPELSDTDISENEGK